MNFPIVTTPGAAAQSPTADSIDAPIRRGSRAWVKRRWAPYVFISPFFILFAVFGLFPLLFSIYLSFQQWDPAEGLTAMKWIGLENYVFILTDPWFRQSMWNTFWIAVASGVPQHVVAIPLAFFIHTSFTRWRNGVIGAYFLPFITSSVAIAMIFGTLFSKNFGVINSTIMALAQVPGLGLLLPSERVDWLGNAAFIKPAISTVVFWRYLGWNTVLYLSALQVIPKDLYEAAIMDGATKWQQFWRITVPLLRPMMFFAVTLTIIGNLQLFEEPFILVGPAGGSDKAGMTTAMLMYQTAFSFGDFGTASAISWLLFLAIAALAWANNKLFARSGMKDGI